MENMRIYALVGVAMLFVGVFLPILQMPIVGSINYVHNGRGDGVIVLLLAIVSFFLILKARYEALMYTGIASLCVLAFTFVQFHLRMNEVRTQMATDLKDNPFRGLAEMAVGSVQLQWGFAVLVLGAGTLLTVGYAMWKQERSEQTVSVSKSKASV